MEWKGKVFGGCEGRESEHPLEKVVLVMDVVDNVKLVVAVTGGREFTDVESVELRFTQLLLRTGLQAHEVMVIDGMARGADEICHRVAVRFGFITGRFPADWKKDGRSAGFCRNEMMADCLVALDKQVGVIACPGGRGTTHMVSYSLSVGLLVSDLNGKQIKELVPA